MRLIWALPSFWNSSMTLLDLIRFTGNGWRLYQVSQARRVNEYDPFFSHADQVVLGEPLHGVPHGAPARVVRPRFADGAARRRSEHAWNGHFLHRSELGLSRREKNLKLKTRNRGHWIDFFRSSISVSLVNTRDQPSKVDENIWNGLTRRRWPTSRSDLNSFFDFRAIWWEFN